MSRLKAKSIRLIDMLAILNDADIVVVMFKNGSKPTHSNYVRQLRIQLDSYLGCHVVGMLSGGSVTLLIDD